MLFVLFVYLIDQSFLRTMNGRMNTLKHREFDFTLIADLISTTQNLKKLFVKDNISYYYIIFGLL